MQIGSNKKAGRASKVRIDKFENIFGGSAGQEHSAEQIINAPLTDLHTFKDHPFRVEDNEKMEETTESICQYGVLVPGIVRPREGGGYEIIAGHRRKRGSELAGKTEMSVIVLYNAPNTMNHYYQQLVQHDMYGGGWE